MGTAISADGNDSESIRPRWRCVSNLIKNDGTRSDLKKHLYRGRFYATSVGTIPRSLWISDNKIMDKSPETKLQQR